MKMLAACLALASASCVAQEPPRFVSLTFDNDFFAGTDRHYSSGVQVAVLADVGSLPAVLRESGPFAWSADPQFVLSVGQRIFTPSDLELSTAEHGDRRYAGWLYLMADLRTRSDSVIDHLTMNVGVVGPASGAQQTQNSVHRLLRSQQASGWEAQIDNRAAAMVGYERAWKAILAGRFAGHDVDLTPRVAATLGNVLTYANAGAVLRFGSALPSDIPATHISLGPARDGYRGASRFGWYAWAGVDARAVARNMFIDTSWRDGSSIHRRSYGFDIQLGAALAWPKARIGFAMVQRSREFYEQDKPDRYGQLTIAYAY